MAALKYDIICRRHNKVLFAPLSVLVGRCRLDVFFVVFAVFEIVYIHYFRILTVL